MYASTSFPTDTGMDTDPDPDRAMEDTDMHKHTDMDTDMRKVTHIARAAKDYYQWTGKHELNGSTTVCRLGCSPVPCTAWKSHSRLCNSFYFRVTVTLQ